MWVEEVLLAKVCQNLAVRSFVLWRVPNLGRRSQVRQNGFIDFLDFVLGRSYGRRIKRLIFFGETRVGLS